MKLPPGVSRADFADQASLAPTLLTVLQGLPLRQGQTRSARNSHSPLGL